MDDIRESPALDLIGLMQDRGAEVAYHDPYVEEIELDSGFLRSVSLTADRLDRTDLVVHRY